VQARAAATTSWTKLSSKVWKCTVAWSGTSSNTTIADAGISGMVLYAEVVPADSPTADYDITITNAAGIDLFGGQLNNLSSSAAERREPVVPYVYWSGAHTFTWSNQSEASASGTVYVYIRTP
ncbi:MAG: hypothetical protein JRJ69_16685, partial [Deltaproteobacteria bacterium]|nr:hypothetical protein [Deltaproteobacteria bacterium]